MDVSVLVTCRFGNENNEVDVIGHCEGTYNALVLYMVMSDIAKKASKYGGKTIPWRKEPEYHKFYCAFKFETEAGKNAFITELLSSD